MTYYRDLDVCDYIFGRSRSGPRLTAASAARLRAAGWLSVSEAYVRGNIGQQERDRLEALLRKAWQPVFYKGCHTCELCSEARSIYNLFIPGREVVFVSPEGILHYIDRHQYLPPREFLDAVMGCPEMGSQAYFAALIQAGGQEFAEVAGLIAATPTPCPYCGRPLITPRAKVCQYCKMDWHDPEHPRKLGAA